MAIERLDKFLEETRSEAVTKSNLLMSEATELLSKGFIDDATKRFEEAKNYAIRLRDIDLIKADFITLRPSRMIQAIQPAEEGAEEVKSAQITQIVTEQPQKVTLPDSRQDRYLPGERLLSLLSFKERPSARRRVLELFLLSPDVGQLHVREIGRRIEGEINEVRKELRLLEGLGILISTKTEQDNRIIYYSVNPNHKNIIGWVVPLTQLLHTIRGDEIPTKGNTPILPMEERDRIVKTLRDQGLSNKEIVERTGIGYTTVLSSIDRISKKGELTRIHAKHMTDIEDYVEKIKEYRSKKFNPKEIRNLLGLSQSQLDRLVHIIRVRESSTSTLDQQNELNEDIDQLNAQLSFTPEVVIPISKSTADIATEAREETEVSEEISFAGLTKTEISFIASTLFIYRKRLIPYLQDQNLKFIEPEILEKLINMVGEELSTQASSKTKEEMQAFVNKARITALEKAKGVVTSPDFPVVYDQVGSVDEAVGHLLIHLSELDRILPDMGDGSGLSFMQDLLYRNINLEYIIDPKTRFVESIKFKASE